MLSNSPFHCKTALPFASMTHGDSASLHRALPTPSQGKAWSAQLREPLHWPSVPQSRETESRCV